MCRKAGLHRFVLVDPCGKCRDRDGRRFRLSVRRFVRANPPQQRKSILIRHPDIEKDDINGLAPETFHGFCSRLGADSLCSSLFENRREELSRARVIVDDQNSHSA